MGGKKILIALVIIAAIATGYVLVRDARDNLNNERGLGKAQVSKQTETKAEKTVDAQSGFADQGGANDVNNNSNNKVMELQIKTTQEGTGDRVVKNGDTISVLYTGKLMDGTVFDASSKNGGTPFGFTVGKGNVIKGWDQGLLGAKVGEKRTLTIPSELGYGKQGYPPKIPGNATLIFEVELVSIK